MYPGKGYLGISWNKIQVRVHAMDKFVVVHLYKVDVEGNNVV